MLSCPSTATFVLPVLKLPELMSSCGVALLLAVPVPSIAYTVPATGVTPPLFALMMFAIVVPPTYSTRTALSVVSLKIGLPSLSTPIPAGDVAPAGLPVSKNRQPSPRASVETIVEDAELHALPAAVGTLYVTLPDVKLENEPRIV